MNGLEQLMKIEDVAKILNVSTRTVKRYTALGELEYYKLGNGAVRFDARQIENFLKGVK